MFFQIGFPKRITLETNEEGYKKAAKLTKELNGKAPVFRSVYNFVGEPRTENAIIDKLFFDFDYDFKNPDKAQSDLIKLHEYLLDKDIKHVLLFSGRGFHLFAYAEKISPGEAKNPTNILRNSFKDFEKKLNICIDHRARDVMRFARIPGTINTKTGLHCIFLDNEMVYKDRQEIIEIAKTPNKIEKYIFGSKLLELHEFDVEPDMTFVKYEIDEGEINEDVVLRSLPKCLASSLLHGDCRYDERYAIITAMRDLLIPKDVAKDTLKTYLTPEKYKHCITQENQLNYLYDRPDLLCPSCRTLRENGLCVKGCTGYNIYI